MAPIPSNKHQLIFLFDIPALREGWPPSVKIFFSGPRKPPFSRASTRSDPAAQSAPAFIVYLLSAVVIRKIVLTEQDKMVPFWTECGLSEQQAKIIFQYTVHGSYMVNKAFHFQRTDEWYHMTCALFTFVTGGYRALYKRTGK